MPCPVFAVIDLLQNNKEKAMLIYWIIFILSLIGVILDNGKAKNTLYFYFLLFCLVVICALRKESVGTDTPLYLMTIKKLIKKEMIKSNIGGKEEILNFGWYTEQFFC